MIRRIAERDTGVSPGGHLLIVGPRRATLLDFGASGEARRSLAARARRSLESLRLLPRRVRLRLLYAVALLNVAAGVWVVGDTPFPLLLLPLAVVGAGEALILRAARRVRGEEEF